MVCTSNLTVSLCFDAWDALFYDIVPIKVVRVLQKAEWLFAFIKFLGNGERESEGMGKIKISMHNTYCLVHVQQDMRGSEKSTPSPYKRTSTAKEAVIHTQKYA